MLLNVSPERLSFREEALQLEIEHLAQLSERHLFVRETGYESNYKPAKEDSADNDTPLASERRSTRMSVLTGLEQQLVERIEQEATAPAAGDAGTSLSKDEEVGVGGNAEMFIVCLTRTRKLHMSYWNLKNSGLAMS
mmetsp:Transcript_31829/g.83091  ORF Transcript_31829/g.83091 Transcript_31829/m.83091 type:complete len:137 (-) Transcript_31829:290-700(-)